MRRILSLADVVAWRLCVGCGACAYICPEQKVRLFDFIHEGIRPVVEGDCGHCPDCLAVCPAVQSDFRRASSADGSPADVAFEKEWGPVTGIWEGYATDPEIRFAGSSGGALTALAAYCVEMLGMHGVLHTGRDPAAPIRNRTRLSRTRKELLEAAGSRYSPASVGNGLGLVENAPSPCVIIGRPVEIAAVRNACQLRPRLAAKVGVMLSFYCAETPPFAGTLALLQRVGIPPEQVKELRYRGHGWPGHFAVEGGDGIEQRAKMTYRESWGFLQAFRPWSAHLWPDGGGELADVSCGDPWYVEPDGLNPGFSLVVARTARGRELVEGAMRAGYLTLQPAEPWKLIRSQQGLLEKKGAVWGRRLALKMLGLPTMRLPGLDLYHSWRRLPVSQKLRSVLGTLRRALQRGLYRRLRLDPGQARPAPEPIAAGELLTG